MKKLNYHYIITKIEDIRHVYMGNNKVKIKYKKMPWKLNKLIYKRSFGMTIILCECFNIGIKLLLLLVKNWKVG